MSEPRLEDIDDYDTLKGQKKRVVWAVIFTTLIMGVIYTIIAKNYSTVDDAIEVKGQNSKIIPMR